MRKSGVLMHLSSLPSPYGIGTMGKVAYEFVDFLHAAGQKIWQLLPICPTSFGDSPYQSCCIYAGNPYFIDLDLLTACGLLEKADYEYVDWEAAPDCINYGALYEKRYPILHKAADKFLEVQKEEPSEEFDRFCEENAAWLSDYALFMTLKDLHHGAPWSEWGAALRNREEAALEEFKKENEEQINFWKIIQYFFFKQWYNLKRYANERGIEIIGDLPIYVSLDSVDAWAHPELFQLDEDRVPKEVAGCPPDGFSADGQLWGNPLYDWDYMEKDGFSWWVERIHYLCQVYDILRIDHFRGFDAYYAIPNGETSAKNGVWKQGPGMKLFHAVEEQIGRQPIIAEDLGHLTDSVRELLKDSGFPGMKVLEFAFDSRDANGNDYLPHNFVKNCVAYAGTHDNDTINGWFQNADPADTEYAKRYLRIAPGEELNWGMMESLWGTVAELTVVQAQDLLGLGGEARMNTPSTVGNWTWRAWPGVFSWDLAHRISDKMRLYKR